MSRINLAATKYFLRIAHECTGDAYVLNAEFIMKARNNQGVFTGSKERCSELSQS